MIEALVALILIGGALVGAIASGLTILRQYRAWQRRRLRRQVQGVATTLSSMLSDTEKRDGRGSSNTRFAP